MDQTKEPTLLTKVATISLPPMEAIDPRLHFTPEQEELIAEIGPGFASDFLGARVDAAPESEAGGFRLEEPATDLRIGEWYSAAPCALELAALHLAHLSHVLRTVRWLRDCNVCFCYALTAERQVRAIRACWVQRMYGWRLESSQPWVASPWPADACGILRTV